MHVWQEEHGACGWRRWLDTMDHQWTSSDLTLNITGDRVAVRNSRSHWSAPQSALHDACNVSMCAPKAMQQAARWWFEFNFSSVMKRCFGSFFFQDCQIWPIWTQQVLRHSLFSPWNLKLFSRFIFVSIKYISLHLKFLIFNGRRHTFQIEYLLWHNFDNADVNECAARLNLSLW